MIQYDCHFDNLKSFYLAKGLSAKDSIFYASEKIKKLEFSNDPFSYKSWVNKLIPYLEVEIQTVSDELLVLDFGCGSGEMVLLMRSLGIKAYGYDIYTEEIEIAKKLALDNGYQEPIFFSSEEDIFDHIGHQKINVLASFSVLEHLSDQYFLEMLDDFYEHIDGCIFAVVPSKYKITDDHTGLKFLGLLPRSVSQMIVSFVRSQYKLSESGDWDVWYRSLSDFKNLSATRNMKLKLVDDSVMYPSLLEVSKIGESGRTSFGALIERWYALFVKLITRNKENLYPYLNFIIKK
ncbi:methyltransferase domain-containing protein [Haliea sp. AH-315-K21]|uniref:Uncharacterized protein n=1 Tax=SAR86 cluster bacterium TaxID=2030880 RepID=A0A2A5CA30_9GAMM|nr:methyltransferase domain-containing protein [Haliea sp. AH-315-K21]PCJ40435.1 MAG: hypothetical protein COA71_11310 [SAR86 cluster bacterium]